MATRTHNAAFLLEANKPFVVQAKETPSPKDGEVLVKVYAAGVNPVDAIIRAGAFKLDYPVIIGTDVAGVIVSVAEGVESFKPGDRLFFQSQSRSRDKAGFQEYVTAPVELIAKLPDSLTFESGATIPLASLTAFKGLFHSTGFNIPFPNPGVSNITLPNQAPSILILGGSSQVGQFTLQFASRLSKFGKIYTTASLTPSNIDRLKALGATDVISRDSTPKELSSLVQEPIDFVVDAISHPDTQLLALDFLQNNLSVYPNLMDDARKPILVLFRKLAHPSSVPATVNVKDNVFGSSYGDPQWSAKFWERIGEWVENGVVEAGSVQIYDGLEKLEEAVQAVGAGVHGSKGVLKLVE